MSRKILYVGPVAFNPNSWRTRAEYIFPDLFSSVGEDIELYLVTGDVPEFAAEHLSVLCVRFSVRHFTIGPKLGSESRPDQWKRSLNEIVKTIKPDVITNSFGAQWLGEVMDHVAAQSGARAVIRVAGDEIGSRLALGMYKDEKQMESELATERAGFVGADNIIAMSPWEKARIANIQGVAAEKIKVCIRGIDLIRFQPDPVVHPKRVVRRFLYVGRRSAEKGYDIIEAVAKKLYREAPEVEFVFVGDFEPGHIENRHYLGWVEAADLPELYRSVDAFVLTSRTEGFPQVVAEAMATGLPCVVSEHLFFSVFMHGEDALLTSLAPDDVAQQILRLVHEPSLAEHLSLRARQIAETSLDQSMWSYRYRAVLFGQSIQENTIFDRANIREVGIQSDKLESLRIAFISPRVFGMMGTLGSYGLAKAFSELGPTMVVSRRSTGQGLLPVVAGDDGLANHHRIDFSDSAAAEEIASLLESFKPDIVHFVNDHCWCDVVPFLRSRYPSAKYVMDFKTPLMAEGDKRWWLQTSGQSQASALDMVVSLSEDIAHSWIPDLRVPLLTYPLGIDVSQIEKRVGNIPRDSDHVRFVYIGQTHPKRKLVRLIELVSGLDDSIKRRFTLDIYGAGGGEDEIDSHISKLGLAGVVNRKSPLPQNELFARLTEYDCGVAWVPNEIFGQAPSLKFLEYAAVGLAVIATDTPAHRRNVAEGFHAPLFDENVASFKDAVSMIMSGKVATKMVEVNRQVVHSSDFKWIARNVLLPEYIKLIGVSTVPLEGGARDEWQGRPRLLFVTPRPLGLMATPGTYLSIEAYAEHCDVEVIAKPHSSDEEIIVHTPSMPLKVTLLDPRCADYVERVGAIIRVFAPKIVCIGLWPDWNLLATALRKEFPDIALALEVKSPITSTTDRMLERRRSDWQRDHHVLDAIIAPSRGMVETSISKIETPFLQHRSIIDFSAISKKETVSDRVICKKFVFAGSFAKLRQLDKLIILFSRLPTDILGAIQVDFFGDGGAKADMVALVNKLGLRQTIRFMGVLPQKDMYQRYREYDAGIAWVPTDVYDSAPSLKLIEYCAAGIVPIATSSSGHRLTGTYGFSINYFEEDDEQSFINAITRLLGDGVATSRLQENIKQAEKFDFRFVIGNEILPFYRKILMARQDECRLPDTLIHALRHTANKVVGRESVRSWFVNTVRGDGVFVSSKMQADMSIERLLHARRIQK